MKPWTDNYIELPFKHNGRDRLGIDCWGLVKLVYREILDIELPDYSGALKDSSPETLNQLSELVKGERPKWKEVKTPSEFDLVLLRIRGLAIHTGIIAPKREFLHILEGINSTVEPLNSLMWRRRIVGYFRHIEAENKGYF